MSPSSTHDSKLSASTNRQCARDRAWSLGPDAIRHSTLSARLVATCLARAGTPPVHVVLWNGTTVATSAAPPVATLRIRDRRTLVKILLNPEFELGECYARGALSIDGNLVDLLQRAYLIAPRRMPPWLRLAKMVGRYDRLVAIPRARANARQHYDLGNDFYRAWLDPTMTYSCAYFSEPDMTLEQAQVSKMELICRKLDLQPGQRVVEAGGGWGSLALYMARTRGVTVHTYNVSREQTAFARRRAKEQGLSQRVTFIEDDYRNIRGHFDAFVSVGMIEHIGRRHYRELGRMIARTLAPEGRGLIHAIGRNRPLPMNAWIRRRIFPDGHAPSLGEMMAVFEPNDFVVVDVENLRPHYAKTLTRWLERFERIAPEVSRSFGEEFVRAWRLYLSSAIASYRCGWLELYQVVFSPARAAKMPWTREALTR